MRDETLVRNKTTKLRLQYGDIQLVPVNNGVYPYNREEYADMWHVPGWRHWAATDKLVELATERGITVRLTESTIDGQTTTRLN